MYGFTYADGRGMEVGISTAAVKTPRGEMGFVFTFLDVTEARKQEREARVQQRLAAVGEMAAGIAHEIRNPLASMSGSLQILREQLPLSEEQGQLMDIVLRESDRLNETIRSFLAYAQAAAPVAFSQFRRASGAHRYRAVAAEQPRAPEGARDPPSTYRRSRCSSTPTKAQIRQIVWNLATNGLRSMPERRGAPARRRPGRGAENAEKVLIAVKDEGIGIAPEDLEGILQPFHGGFERGTGLGLSIVHRIVSDYGGELLMTSARGKGTTVTVKLPAAEKADESLKSEAGSLKL